MPRFKRSARILRPEDYQAVKARGISARSGPIVVAVLPGRLKRLGIAVSKFVGNAVERNRIKRVIREFFRQNQGLFPSGDCVVIPRRGAASLENEKIRERLAAALIFLLSAARGGRCESNEEDDDEDD